MNNVCLSGRITKDLELKFANSGKAVIKFSLAVDRLKKGEADFIQVVVFDKAAEFLVNYAGKGKLIEVEGHIQTGSYEGKTGKVYTTEVIARNVKLLEWGEKKEETETIGFSPIEDSDYIPF